MVETDARQFLAALADRSEPSTPSESSITDASYRDRIDAAIEAVDAFDAAATFLAKNDLDELEDAIGRAEADLSSRASDGREALAALRRLQAAADGTGQFQSGRRSPIGREDVADGR